jgi:protein lifeguard
MSYEYTPLHSPPSYESITNRNGFIKKVYSILYLQLLVTIGVCALFNSVESVKNYVQGPNGQSMLITSMVFQFVIMLILICTNLHKKKPLNLVLLLLFTLFLSYTLGVVSSYYDTKVLLYAGGLTFIVTLGLTLFAFQTKYDFTGAGPYLLSFLLVLIFMGIFAIFVKNDIYNLIYAALGSLLFSFYIVYDTQLIIGGKHKFQFDEEDYVFAALSLYLDIINLFLFILELFDSRK